MAEVNVETIALMASHAELLDADACAFLLGLRGRDGGISRPASQLLARCGLARMHRWKVAAS